MSGVVTMSLDERVARYERIVELRDQGLTYEQIGERFDPPLSRQFVARQLSKGRPKEIGRPRKRV